MTGVVGMLVFASLCVWSGEASAGPAGREVLAELRASLPLSDRERDLLADEVDRYEALGGALGHVRNLLWVGVQWGCREECLSSVISSASVGLARDLTDQRAADLVLEVLRQQLDMREENTSDAELGRLVASTVASRLELFDLCEAISAR